MNRLYAYTNTTRKELLHHSIKTRINLKIFFLEQNKATFTKNIDNPSLYEEEKEVFPEKTRSF